MLAGKPRLVADPTVGVGDLMQPLMGLVQEKMETNIFKLIQPPPNTSWKSAVPVAWLAGLATLFKDYVKIASNACISSKKHKMALSRLMEKESVNFTRKSSSDFIDMVDDTIRMGLAHLRTLKGSTEKRDAAYRKLDKSQQVALDGVLELISTHGSSIQQDDSQPRSSRSPPPAPENRIVLYDPEDADGAEVRAAHVFDRLLEGDTDNAAPTHRLKKKTPSPVKRGSAFHFAFTDDDEEAFLCAAEVEGISKGDKTQLQKLNEKVKASGHHGGRARGRGRGARGRGRVSAASASGKVQVEEKKPQVRKRPAQAMQGSVNGLEEVELPMVNNKREFKINAKLLVIPDAPDPECGDARTKVRHRFTSSAWHLTRDKCKSAGHSEDFCKSHARMAVKEAADVFDGVWPRATKKGGICKKPASSEKLKDLGEKEEEENESEAVVSAEAPEEVSDVD